MLHQVPPSGLCHGQSVPNAMSNSHQIASRSGHILPSISVFAEHSRLTQTPLPDFKYFLSDERNEMVRKSNAGPLSSVFSSSNLCQDNFGRTEMCSTNPLPRFHRYTSHDIGQRDATADWFPSNGRKNHDFSQVDLINPLSSNNLCFPNNLYGVAVSTSQTLIDLKYGNNGTCSSKSQHYVDSAARFGSPLSKYVTTVACGLVSPSYLPKSSSLPDSRLAALQHGAGLSGNHLNRIAPQLDTYFPTALPTGYTYPIVKGGHHCDAFPPHLSNGVLPGAGFIDRYPMGLTRKHIPQESFSWRLHGTNPTYSYPYSLGLLNYTCENVNSSPLLHANWSQIMSGSAKYIGQGDKLPYGDQIRKRCESFCSNSGFEDNSYKVESAADVCGNNSSHEIVFSENVSVLSQIDDPSKVASMSEVKPLLHVETTPTTSQMDTFLVTHQLPVCMSKFFSPSLSYSRQSSQATFSLHNGIGSQILGTENSPYLLDTSPNVSLSVGGKTGSECIVESFSWHLSTESSMHDSDKMESLKTAPSMTTALSYSSNFMLNSTTDDQNGNRDCVHLSGVTVSPFVQINDVHGSLKKNAETMAPLGRCSVSETLNEVWPVGGTLPRKRALKSNENCNNSVDQIMTQKINAEYRRILKKYDSMSFEEVSSCKAGNIDTHQLSLGYNHQTFVDAPFLPSSVSPSYNVVITEGKGPNIQFINTPSNVIADDNCCVQGRAVACSRRAIKNCIAKTSCISELSSVSRSFGTPQSHPYGTDSSLFQGHQIQHRAQNSTMPKSRNIFVGKTRFSCVVCRRTFSTTSSLSRHRKQFHPSLFSRCARPEEVPLNSLSHSALPSTGRAVSSKHLSDVCRTDLNAVEVCCAQLTPNSADFRRTTLKMELPDPGAEHTVITDAEVCTVSTSCSKLPSAFLDRHVGDGSMFDGSDLLDHSNIKQINFKQPKGHGKRRRRKTGVCTVRKRRCRQTKSQALQVSLQGSRVAVNRVKKRRIDNVHIKQGSKELNNRTKKRTRVNSIVS